MDVMHERVAGLDVHKETIVACVRIMVGRKAHRECRTFDTTTFGLVALLTWLTESGCTHVAMEATGVYWKPVWNILSDGTFELTLANAAHIKNVPGRKTDMNDAMWIADLLSCGLIKASFVPEQEIQQLRSLLRARKQLYARADQPRPADSEAIRRLIERGLAGETDVKTAEQRRKSERESVTALTRNNITAGDPQRQLVDVACASLL